MKKVILSLGLIAGISAAASAQASFGIKAGASLTNFTGSDVENASNKIGFHGGLVANLAFSDVLSIQPEVLYSMKGTQEKANSSNKVNLNYIDVPVMLQYNADGLFFEAGPQVGFIASAKNNDVDIKEGIRSVDFGYAVGLGYKVESGPMVGLRYNGGISDIVKDKYGSDGALRNSAFQLYVGYMFGGK